MTRLSFDTFQNVINGELKGADKQYYGINPFDEQKLWPVPVATEEDLNEAVTAGLAAFKKWRRTSVADRRQRLERFAEALVAQKAEWAEVISKETGQPSELAADEVDSAYAWLTGIAQLELPEYMTHDDDDVKATTKYFPLGVVGAICPWNFPVFLAAGKIASALITGNVIIVKPSPFTPYTTLKLAELAQGFFPPGVFQALGGDDKLGPWMTMHPKIAKISFTGSTATGKRIMAAAASTLKRITLELYEYAYQMYRSFAKIFSGGNDAAIVCPDVDLDVVVQKISDDAFVHAGQSCIATKRIYVHASIYDDFLSKFVAAIKKLKLGTGFLGPVQNQMQYDKVKSLFDDCQKQDYKMALGSADLQKEKAGFYIPTAIVADPPEKSRIVQEEPFGPIVPVLKWEDEDDVIDRANATDLGLGATLFCRDPETAERIAAQLEAGNVWVNGGSMPLVDSLFGGIKQSGFGGENGQLGLLNYCDARTFYFAKNV